MNDAILVLNAGSSSIKFALFAAKDLRWMLHGQIEGIGHAPHFCVEGEHATVVADKQLTGATHEDLLGDMLQWIEAHLGEDRLICVGHRVVHGGEKFVAPARIDDAVIAQLEQLTPLRRSTSRTI